MKVETCLLIAFMFMFDKFYSSFRRTLVPFRAHDLQKVSCEKLQQLAFQRSTFLFSYQFLNPSFLIEGFETQDARKHLLRDRWLFVSRELHFPPIFSNPLATENPYLNRIVWQSLAFQTSNRIYG